jgi:hypothetical protein
VVDSLKALDPNPPIREATRSLQCGDRRQGQTCRLGRDILRTLIPLGTVQMAISVARRQFISGLGGVAAMSSIPLSARAQQPAIGYLGSQSAASVVSQIAALKDGLKETGFAVGQNVQMEFPWADDRYDRLPAMAADFVHRQVAVIVAGGGNVSALAAKAATTASGSRDRCAHRQ